MRTEGSAGADPFKSAAFIALHFVVFTITFSNSLFEISAGVFIVLSALSFFRSNDQRAIRNVFFMLAAVYFGFNVISLAGSEFMAQSLRGLFKVVRQILLCAAVVHALDDEIKIRRIFLLFLAVACGIAVDALVQGFTGFEFLRGRALTEYYGSLKRVTGPYTHANNFSAYLSLVFFLFLGTLLEMRAWLTRPVRIFSAIGLILVTGCLYWTFARGAWIAIGISIFCFSFLRGNRRAFFILALVLAVAVVLAPAAVKQRALSVLDKEDGTIRERRQLWSESVRMIQDRPLMGLGVNTYSKNEPRYKDPRVRLDNQYAHNSYLQMAAEIGLPGVASFLVFLAYFFSQTLIAVRRAAPSFLKGTAIAFLSGIFAFLLHSATDTNLQSLLLINTLWLSLGVTWAIRSRLVDTL